VLLLDDDVLVPSDLLERLRRHERPVVSALYLDRRPPFRPLAFASMDWGYVPVDLNALAPDAVVRVRTLGCGALLVERAVLEAVAEPWFPEDGRHDPDLGFADNLMLAGIGIEVDLGARCGHILQPADPGCGLTLAIWPEVDERGWRWRIIPTAEDGAEMPRELVIEWKDPSRPEPFRQLVSADAP